VNSNNEIQGYKLYPMLHFRRKFSSGVTALTCLSLLPSLRALLEGKSIRNLIQGTWASIHEAYVVVVTATTLLLKLDAQVHNWASKGTSLGGRACLSSWLFSLLRCKMSLILPKRLYGVTPVLPMFHPRCPFLLQPSSLASC